MNKYLEAAKEIMCAYELRYWAVFAIIAQIGYFTGLLNGFGVFITILACVIGGLLAGKRIKLTHNTFEKEKYQ